MVDVESQRSGSTARAPSSAQDCEQRTIFQASAFVGFVLLILNGNLLYLSYAQQSSSLLAHETLAAAPQRVAAEPRREDAPPEPMQCLVEALYDASPGSTGSLRGEKAYHLYVEKDENGKRRAKIEPTSGKFPYWQRALLTKDGDQLYIQFDDQSPLVLRNIAPFGQKIYLPDGTWWDRSEIIGTLPVNCR